jgi:hypothetical protein
MTACAARSLLNKGIAQAAELFSRLLSRLPS